MSRESFIDEMIDRSFKTFQSPKPKAPVTHGPPQRKTTISQNEERFLRELAGIDPVPLQVKADLGKELEVIDGEGKCFYILSDSFWEK